MTSRFRAPRLAAPLVLSALGCALTYRAQAQDHEDTDEIIVTGVPRDRAAGELPQSVTVVASDELDRVRAATLGETLANQLGVSSSQFGAGASRPIIRGLDNHRVRILENGTGVQDMSDLGEDHAVPINPLINDRIEVIRGPAGLRYGSQAVGGVVSVENNRIPTSIPPRRRRGPGDDGLFGRRQRPQRRRDP